MTDPRLRAKVLVVDDNVDFCNMLASELSQRYDVVTANSGEEALTKLGESIDAVVTDVRMPNMDGIGLIKRIKGRDPEMTVVAMTAESSIEDADSVHRAGAVQYIVKNIGRGGMAKLVEKLYPIIEPRVWARISDFNFTESRKVLVVDSSDRVGGVRRACGEHAAKLLQASSYSEVYTAFQHARIGLVLLNARPDTHNTSYDGAEIARTIRRTYPFTNIVAYGTRAGEDAATELLFAKTASRAFNKDELLRNIGDVIQENFNARKWRVEKHLNMYPPGFWAIAGCRTSGKSLIINGLMAALPWLFKHKSITSRQKREGETDSDHIFESESYIKNLPDKRYLKYTYAEDFYAHDTARYTNEFDLSGKDIVVPVTNPLVLPEVQKMFLRVKQDQELHYANMHTLFIHASYEALKGRLNKRSPYYSVHIYPDIGNFDKMVDKGVFDTIIRNSAVYADDLDMQVSASVASDVQSKIQEATRAIWETRFPGENLPF